MSQPKSSKQRKTSSPRPLGVESATATDRSCRVALLLLFFAAGCWLLAGSVFGLISSIKFHSPGFLASDAWLTYGRTRPAFFNALLYGFCVPASLGAVLWMFTRLGKVALSHGWLAILGTLAWNLGVALGLAGILRGDSTGYEYLEMPGYAAPMLFCGYSLLALCAAITVHQRTERSLYVSQWLLLAGLFWFPWIFSTAHLLVSVFPARGIVQNIIGWWFARNLTAVWVWLTGLGLIFYFLPKLLGRELTSRHLALFTFWTLLLFGPWGGIPVVAPVPAWMPALSTASSLLMVVPLIAVALICSRTAAGGVGLLWRNPVGRFILAGVGFLLVAGVGQLLIAWPSTGRALGLSWFVYAHAQFNLVGFLTLVLLGAAFYILPRVAGVDLSPPANLTFWLIAGGTAVAAAPLALAGLREAARFGKFETPFMEIVQSTLMYLRISTIGELLIVAGCALFLVFVVRVILALVRPAVRRAYTEVTRDLIEPTRVKS